MEPKPTYEVDSHDRHRTDYVAAGWRIADIERPTDAGDVATTEPAAPYCQLCGSIAAVVADHPAGPLYYCQRCGTGEYIVIPDGDDDLPPELDFDQLAEIARGWPWNVRDVLARFVATAMKEAGIDDRRKRYAVEERLGRMMGDI